MNRPGVGPQSLRSLPNGFSTQQQLPQTRSASSRLPNGKMVSNAATWAFGGGPMGSAGLSNARPNNAPMTSFAQTVGASQPATSLDLSEFPSLSGNQPQQASTSAQSTWAMPSTRSLGQAASQRSQQQSMLPIQQGQAHQQTQQQQQQDDLFSSSSQLSTSQASFRFGGQTAVGQSSQANTADEFPPLSRNINGEIGQDRTLGLLPNVGFGAQSSGSAFGGGLGGSQGVRNNGLLNALSGNIRAPLGTSQVASPGIVGGLSASRSATDPIRQSVVSAFENESNGFARSPHSGIPNVLGLRDSGLPSTLNTQSAPKQDLPSHPQSAVSQQRPQTNDFGIGTSQDVSEDPTPDVEDPLAGMSDKDRFGLKGLLAILKGPYPDQSALLSGIDIAALGFDLTSTERVSEMIWSPWDDIPARPDIPKYTLPECYQVHNVQPIENKLSNFSDETLMFMFYSNPQDIQQMIAAQELTNRNWRYHKKLQLWLTKDDMMVPQVVNAGSERGYYVFFDPKTWSRERRDFVLAYSDLETSSSSGPPGSLS